MGRLKRISLILTLIFTVAIGAFLAWASMPLPASQEAFAALKSGPDVQVSEAGWAVFQAAGEEVDTGLILYPGGRVDWRAYAPAARAIAAQGYVVVIVPMPLNLAVFAPDRAEEVMAAYPEIRRWVIGGHSLGGAMAARFADRFPEAVQGLVLWAAYPASSNDLSGDSLQVLSLIGSRDGLGTGQGLQAARPLLPPGTRFVEIDGGNHAQFGWYGEQPGDAPATITRREQQAQVVQATVEFLSGIE